MNERLKELYQQAHMVREYPADDPMRGGNPPTVYWGGERSAERFAELIVRECIMVCWPGGESDILYEQANAIDKAFIDGQDACVERLKQHFGVEEPRGWVCPKCGIDRTKESCPNGHHAALTGHCPMIGVAL
jgi:hypothetical protein